jgi:hypothetical protein
VVSRAHGAIKVEETFNELERIRFVPRKVCKRTEWGKIRIGAGCC